LTGLEHLALQGFDLGRTVVQGIPGGGLEEIQLSDRDLRHLAGNSITVPVVSEIMAVAKILSPPASSAGARHLGFDAGNEVLFFGSAARRSGPSTCMDCLRLSSATSDVSQD
jgi:hypothetical protein